MIKRNIAQRILGYFMPSRKPVIDLSQIPQVERGQGEKGQKRQTRQKQSGVAQAKRAATKRNNIRKQGK